MRNPASLKDSNTNNLKMVHPSNNAMKYTIDMRHFIIMLFVSISFFFTLGAWTAWNDLSSYPLLNNTMDMNEHHINFQQPSFEDLGHGEGPIRYNQQRQSSSESPSIHKNAESHNDTHKRSQLPVGQHFLVDIKNVQASFLDCEKRLAQAMVDAVQSVGLNLLSYHCHTLVPSGVSCVGVISGSHISFHTWPEEGVITLDLLTSNDDSPIMNVVSELSRLFGIPKEGEDGKNETIITEWVHELRGFPYHGNNDYEFRPADKTNYLHSKSDLSTWVLSDSSLYSKEQIVSMTSEFNRIDIWDVVLSDQKPSHWDALKHDLKEGDPRWMTPEIASPRRILFVNGTIMGMDPYVSQVQESLVHPAMITHPNPINVAVIGGADGSTIREILKYNTVESITMIEVDKTLIDVSREYLSSRSDCSDIIDTATNCFDDERVTIIIEDPITWFINNYGPTSSDNEQTLPKENFDVIIISTADPKDKPELYNNEVFLSALMNSLSDNGTLAAQLDDAHTINDPRPEFSIHSTCDSFMQLLEMNEHTGAMFVYEEAHTGLDEPSSFLTVCKNVNCRGLWYSDAMLVDYQLSVRMRKTKSKQPILTHFDGSTHFLFQTTPRAWEEVYCRRDPVPFECNFRGLDLSKDIFEFDSEDEDNNSFKVATIQSDDDKSGNRAIYASVDIPVGSYVMPSDLTASFSLTDNMYNNLKSLTEIQDVGDMTVINRFLNFVNDHSHVTCSKGYPLKYIEVGATFMMRKSSNDDEVNVGRWMPQHPSGDRPVYSPVYDRHALSFDLILIATKDIKKGEELVKPMNLW